MPGRHGDDDINDILSSIMRGEKPTTHQPQHAPVKNQAHQSAPKPAQPKPTPVHAKPLSAQSHTPKLAAAPAYKSPRKRKYRIKKKVLVPFVLILMIGATAFAAKPVSSYIFASSPFNPGLADSTSFPLLYPSKLPSGYSLDKESVSQAENGAVIYAIKNKDGNIINVSLQEQPSGLNLKPLFDTMSEIRQIDTPAGETTIGVAKDKMLTTHTTTGSVWVITRTPADKIDASAVESMLKSLKEG